MHACDMTIVFCIAIIFRQLYYCIYGLFYLFLWSDT